MRESQGVRLLLSAAVSVSVLAFGLAQTARSENPAGHAIAEKFATDGAGGKAEKRNRGGATPQSHKPDGRAEEADMLARARAEADDRRRELERERAAAEEGDRRARDAARIEEERRTEEARRRDEEQLVEAARRADDERRFEESRKAEEQRRAAAGREDEERRIEEARRAVAEALRIEEERQARELAAEQERRRTAEALAEQERRRAADARRASEEAVREARRRADEKSRLAAETAELEQQAATAAQAAERDFEARRITESLASAAQARAERERARESARSFAESQSGNGRMGAGEVEPRFPHEADRDYQDKTTASHRVSVLLVMEPGSRGIRRHNKSADPLLCINGGCYVSNGPASAARFMAGRKALGLGRTLGERAGACSNSLGCVFRGIDLGSLPTLMQPIDMRLVRHDRRPSQQIDGPSDCRLDTGRLQCRQTIDGGSYHMWIVPEDVANRAGPDLLERAVAEGLPASRTAALSR
jgi:hypothetical protein